MINSHLLLLYKSRPERAWDLSELAFYRQALAFIPIPAAVIVAGKKAKTCQLARED
jgi:hypothetical protein